MASAVLKGDRPIYDNNFDTSQKVGTQILRFNFQCQQNQTANEPNGRFVR